MKYETVVNDYMENCRGFLMLDLEYYKAMPSLLEAISAAALALDHKGEKHSHQKRLKVLVLERAKEMLLSKHDEIQAVKNFDDLYEIIRLDKVPGYGELAIYDAALRIGAYLNIYPTKVYLQRGALIGAKNLLQKKLPSRTIEVNDLPKEFHILTAHEIENLLCIFKDRFE